MEWEAKIPNAERADVGGSSIEKEIYEKYCSDILTAEAIQFLVSLDKQFGQRIRDIRAARQERHDAIDHGQEIDFPDDERSKIIRNGKWRIVGAPKSCGVELVSPAIPKKIARAAKIRNIQGSVTDFEDAHHWDINLCLEGQRALRHRIWTSERPLDDSKRRRRIADRNKVGRMPILKMRPNGFGALPVREVQLNGMPIERIIFDFGLFFFHNAVRLVEIQHHPYFYFPKLEHADEARLLRHLLLFSEKQLNLPAGVTLSTVHIETLLAAFQIDSILFELAGGTDEDVDKLKDGSAIHFENSSIIATGFGWHDYIFDLIRTTRCRPDFLWPQASDTSLKSHPLRSAWRLIVGTGLKRGVISMGGMAVQIPDGTIEPKKLTFAKKAWEIATGAQGVWIAHPDLAIAANSALSEENWRYIVPNPDPPDISHITSADILAVPKGERSLKSLENNIERLLEYTIAWLGGVGCIAFKGIMEDVATSERARTELWTWIKYEATLNDGSVITETMVLGILESLVEQRRAQLLTDNAEIRRGADPSIMRARIDVAVRILRKVISDESFTWTITPILFEEYLKLEDSEI